MTNAPNRISFPLFAAGILGLTGVALGAMGAHALKAVLADQGMIPTWDTAARYQLLHAVALVGLAAWTRASTGAGGGRLATWAAGCWLVGTLLFSGSLYWWALGGARWLVHLTPIGGLVLIVGWLLVTIAAFGKRP